MNARILYGIAYFLITLLIIIFSLLFGIIKFDLVAATAITFIFTSYIPVWVYILKSNSSSGSSSIK